MKRILLLLSLASPLFAGTTRLTWMSSGLPAASLDVRLDDGTVIRSDGNGAVDVRGSKSIVITDPESGLELIAGTVSGDVPIRVPEPIRVRGRATGTGGAVTVHFRAGAPPRWSSVTAEDGRFTSGWLVADPPPVVLIEDARGNTAVVEVPSVDVRPRAAIELGATALERSAILEIAPDGGSASSAELHIRTEATTGTADARELAALERRDRRLYESLLLGRPYYLAADAGARIALPRWLTRATVTLRDSWGDRFVEREVSFTPGQVTRLEWPAAAPQAAVIVGTITSAGAPVPNATVVVPDGARRHESRTDIGGRFRFDGVRAAAVTSVYVDAGTGNDRRTAVFHVAPGSGLSLELPSSAPDAVDLPAISAAVDSPLANCNVGDEQYPMVVAQSIPPGARYDYSLNWNDVTMTVVADRPGTYAFNVYATTFFFLQASVQVTSSAPATAPMTYIPPENVTLQIFNKNGFNLPQGLELAFAPPYEVAEWLDATELDLSATSSVFLPCVNINPLALYINDGRGNGCDGDLVLKSRACTIFLPSDPLRPCACQ